MESSWSRTQQQGYLHACDALSATALELADHILQDWCERQIDEWLQQGLIDDVRHDLDFGHRLVEVWE
ncbi:MAG TPA: hypothetical protein EYQ31_08585, partial [Candidatus Handelsmanbacteria bacterium]|nr:hypothetical protein [Candidatus Handelsmanbacteria bacterium]